MVLYFTEVPSSKDNTHETVDNTREYQTILNAKLFFCYSLDVVCPCQRLHTNLVLMVLKGAVFERVPSFFGDWISLRVEKTAAQLLCILPCFWN